MWLYLNLLQFQIRKSVILDLTSLQSFYLSIMKRNEWNRPSQMFALFQIPYHICLLDMNNLYVN